MKTRSLLAFAALLAALAVVQLQARASKNNVGQTLPEMNLSYPGAAPTLKGKPLLIEFWATWCGPCRTSIPHLNELYKKFHPKGLEAVGITEEEVAVIKAFQKDMPMEYPVGIDKDDKVGSAFGITHIPHALLLDKTGKVVWEGYPSAITEGQIEELLK